MGQIIGATNAKRATPRPSIKLYKFQSTPCPLYEEGAILWGLQDEGQIGDNRLHQDLSKLSCLSCVGEPRMAVLVGEKLPMLNLGVRSGCKAMGTRQISLIEEKREQSGNVR